MSAFASGEDPNLDPNLDPNQKSIITLYVISHGKDIPDAPVSDPSVRILSQAGKFGCFGFFNYIEPTKVKAWITNLKNKNPQISTYSILEKINILFQIASDINRGIFNPEKYITAEDKIQLEKGNKTIHLRQSRHTEKVIKEYKDWQIYTPIIDHLYDFNDATQRGQGIFIVDIKNKPAQFEFSVDDNLMNYINFDIKNEFKLMKIEDFFEENKNFEEEEKKEIIQKLRDFGCYRLDDFSTIYFYLYEEIIPILGKQIINKIITTIKNPEKGYLNLEHKDTIYLSRIIKFLKDAGFDIINIIDKSCRAYGAIMSKEEFAKINDDEDKASESIDKTLGGKKRRKSTRKRRKRRNFKRKTRITK